MQTKSIQTSLLAIAAVALALPLAFGQPRDRDGRGPRWDASKVTTIEGTIASVNERQGRRGPAQANFKLTTADGDIMVMTGPAAWLKEKGFEPKAGDTVSVTGIKNTRGERTMFMAQKITCGGTTVTLRDDEGKPLWPRQNRGERGDHDKQDGDEK